MLQKRYVRFLSVLLSLAFLAFTGCTNSQEQIPVSTPGTPVVQAEASEPEQSQTSNREDGAPFSLTMLDVGQGLSILVQADGEYLLYDGGGRGASSYVVAYLKLLFAPLFLAALVCYPEMTESAIGVTFGVFAKKSAFAISPIR